MEIKQTSSEEVRNFVRDQVITYNMQQLPGEKGTKKETTEFTIQDESGDITGGVTCTFYWHHLHIDFLWVEETKRHSGYGTKLLMKAEDFARKNGARLIKLDSFSFQAPHFYQKHGYSVYGKLEDHPAGHTQYYLVKRL
ncbi:GNAT family N-acetyltransferase [Terribacillus sp. DMT04]|uniref:GNAT family N-acetyltransferase n=1 Tax=Terribacillus sp. DMT04 TaxID=2850441 RepID=UPI001C2C2813|nr:GNAT family N-acetyltransferase [Terribacillus sp. DMT04]QXE02589.1 GNAT family N-acetyltransferase [Terribacillus sp. DMT04]